MRALLVAAALLAGCGETTPSANRPAGLTIGVGGSVGMTGVVSQSR